MIALVSRVLWVGAAVLGAALLASAPAPARGSGTTLSASVTPAGHLTSTYQWTVQKSASPESQMVPVGSSASVSYMITTTKSSSGVIAAWLDGKVCVTNTGSVDTQGLAISDQLTKPPSKSVLSTVVVDVGAMPVAAGQSSCYPFRISVPAASLVAGATYKDSAQVTIKNDSGHLGVPTGPTPSASAALPASPAVVDGSITVDDHGIGRAFDFGASGTENYVEGLAAMPRLGPRRWSRTTPRRSRRRRRTDGGRRDGVSTTSIAMPRARRRSRTRPRRTTQSSTASLPAPRRSRSTTPAATGGSRSTPATRARIRSGARATVRPSRSRWSRTTSRSAPRRAL